MNVYIILKYKTDNLATLRSFFVKLIRNYKAEITQPISFQPSLEWKVVKYNAK